MAGHVVIRITERLGAAQPSAQLCNSGDVPADVGLKKLCRSGACLGRSYSSRGVGCVFPAQQLKREQSLASCFSRADASCHGISNTWFACGFPSSSLTWPASQTVSSPDT